MQQLQTLISSVANSKWVLILALSLMATQAHAVDKQWVIKDRDGKNLVDAQRTLTDLNNDQTWTENTSGWFLENPSAPWSSISMIRQSSIVPRLFIIT
jgi:hypothetical protein